MLSNSTAVLPTAAAVLGLLGLALAALTLFRVPLRLAVATASGRAVLQLSAVGLLLTGVLRAPLAVAGFLALMLTVACATTTRRLGRTGLVQRLWTPVLLASLAGAVPSVGMVFAVGALPESGRYLLALGGIVLGNTMTASTLTGRRFADALVRRREEVEGWLALGATPRIAAAPLARDAVHEALIPGVDQTRTVGLVTLPGALVGALAGGASAAGAARFQLIVLVALLAAQSLSATTLAYLVGAPAQLPEPPGTR
jgi:UDP-glucose/iron transport system permease protein